MYKIKTLSPKVAHIPMKPSNKAWEYCQRKKDKTGCKLLDVAKCLICYDNWVDRNCTLKKPKRKRNLAAKAGMKRAMKSASRVFG